MKKSKLKHSLGKTVQLLTCAWVIAFGLSSCDSDRLNGGGVGSLRLSLTADTTSLNKGVSNSTKASLADEFAKFLMISDYKIQIVQGDKAVKSYDRFDQMPSEIELQEGTYTLIASKGDNLPAAFENPYFEGSTEFTVKAEMNTPINVTCTLGNARVTVDYTEDFKKVYGEYATLLKTSFTSTNLEIVKDEIRPAYLQIAKEGTALNISIRLKKIGGTESKVYPVPTDIPLERRQNVRLIFKTDGASNGIGLDVQIDDKMEEVTFWPEIPDFMLPENKN